MAKVQIEASWLEKLQSEFDKPYFEQLIQFVKTEYAQGTCYPPGKLIFNAFNLCPLPKVKVVLIGQDPYHEPQQAHGLCFSVNDGVPFPPSLRNIFQEIQTDLGKPVPQSGNLTRWAEQGVLLLNATLTVRAHMAASHQKRGWEEFTDAIIRKVNEQDRPVVYMLWGRPAQMKKSMLNNPKHLILEAPHPSPLSAYRGFFGCKHFSKANEFLMQNGLAPIDWQIEDI